MPSQRKMTNKALGALVRQVSARQAQRELEAIGRRTEEMVVRRSTLQHKERFLRKCRFLTGDV